MVVRLPTRPPQPDEVDKQAGLSASMTTPSIKQNGVEGPCKSVNDCNQQDVSSNTSHIETKMIKSSQAGESRQDCQDSNNNTKSGCNAIPSINDSQDKSGQSSAGMELAGTKLDEQVISKTGKMATNTDSGNSNKSKIKSGGFLRGSSRSNKDAAKSRGNKASSNQASNNNNNNNKIQQDQANTTEPAGQREKHPSSSSSSSTTKPYKSLVDELKIFQNSNLLNQQDPLEQLHQQLNELINEDDGNSNAKNKRFRPMKSSQQLKTTEARLPLPLAANGDNNKFDHSLSSSMQSSAKQAINSNENDGPRKLDSSGGGTSTSENISTIKKGVLWQQQNYDKFHQRLFSRWKKRYFILTTDYLVCFKRSSSKVGRSEMGKFLYKTPLADVQRIEWLRPNKSDKGAIILTIRGQCFELHLWCKQALDEWMFMLKESVDRLNMRRSLGSSSCNLQLQNGQHQSSKTMDQNNGSNQTSTTLGDPREAAKILSDAMEATNLDNRKVSKAEQTSSSWSSPSSGPSNQTSGSRRERQGQRNEQVASEAHAQAHKEQPLKSGLESIERNPPESGEGAINAVSPGTSMATKEPQTVMIYDEEGQRKGPADDDHHHHNDDNQQCQQVRAQVSPEENRQRQNSSQSTPSATETTNTADSRAGPTKRVANDQRDANNHQNNRRRSLRHKQDNHKTSGGTGNSNQSVSDSARPLDELCDQTDRLAELQESLCKSNGQSRPETVNLIRRDDSWQSLVSLTRVGRVSSMQVAQRSLYAQHIMPEGAASRTPQVQQQQANGHLKQQQSIINIESSVTPIRAAPLLLRQQSMQSPAHLNGARKLTQRPLPPIGQHAASFDGQPANSPLLQQPPTSYQHKLLQLQMLHSQNRGPNNDNNDYQIYGPGSTTTTNHYGYYSMRSNLKSAASEFSFIRPSPSNLQQQQQHQQQPFVSSQQSTLPHPNSSQAIEGQFQQPIRSSLVLQTPGGVNTGELAHLKQQQNLQLSNEHNNGQVNPEHHQITLASLAAPNRDLPLKPNRRRVPADASQPGGGKNSSLGSSIASFFRRAFSRRSKRQGRRSKMLMAESCSSSMGAFDEANFAAHQVVLPSAFSTGSKSIEASEDRRQRQLAQPQRMVDMIEAFANKTSGQAMEQQLGMLQDQPMRQVVEVNNTAVGRPPMNSMSFYGSPRMTPQRMPAYQPNNNDAKQFGASPLHKSNSISTTMGLSGGLSEVHNYHLMNSRQQGLYYDNEAPIESPLMTRSAKVMSANLTPLFARKEAMIDGANQFLSPRTNRQDYIAAARQQRQRPSSIYGQPSMISSPSMSNRNEDSNFGLHRSSIHGTSNQSYRDRASPGVGSDLHRRHQMGLKAVAHLDPTREVAEELASPTGEFRAPLDVALNHRREPMEYDERDDDHQAMNADRQQHLQLTRFGGQMMLESPVQGRPEHKFARQQRQAIVNPILQSPTMGTIYDNHPMPSQRFVQQSYSHYDNQHLTDCHGDPSSGQLAARLSGAQMRPEKLDYLQQTSMVELQQPNPSGQVIRCTPSRQPFGSGQERSGMVGGDVMLLANGKPSAIVAPTTPNHYGRLSSSNGLHSQHLPQSQSMISAISSNASPMSSRRLLGHSTNQPGSLYHQSPLVSGRQTRLLSKADGTQATVTYNDRSAMMMGEDSRGQAVVNIAGAPGINLEPSLAASLLRGTNINAYESSTASRLGSHQSSSSKAFLVSTRLSKSMASENQQQQQLRNGQEQRNAEAGEENNTVSSKSSREESSLSGTSPSLSSSSRPPKENPSINNGLANNGLDVGSGDDGQDSSERSKSSRDGAGGRVGRHSSSRASSGGRASKSSASSRSSCHENSGKYQSQLKQQHQKQTTQQLQRDRRGSSLEHSDEVASSSHNGSLDEPDTERNWITSKLVQ